MMDDYTVEVTTAPVEGDEWSTLRRVLDIVPGTLLIEDPEEPMLVIPVQAGEPMKAAMFVDGLAKLVGLEIKSGNIYPTPEADFDFEDDGDEEVPDSDTEVVRALGCYVAKTPEFDGKLTQDGRLVTH